MGSITTMSLRIWELKSGCVHPVPHEGTVLALSAEDARHWAEVEHEGAAALAAVVEPLHLSPLLREQLLDDDRTNRIAVSGTTILIEFPCAVDVDRDPHPYVSIVVSPTFLLTVLRQRKSERDALIDRLQHQLKESPPDVRLVAAHVLEDLVEEMMEFAAGVRDECERLTTMVLRHPLKVPLDAVQTLTRRLQHTALVAEDQLFCLDSLVGALGVHQSDPRFIQPLDQLRLQLVHVLKLINRLTEHMRSLHAHAASARNDRDSSRLKTLTIYSAVFLPLNLIAGIYGMNFDRVHPWNMPELGWEFGYFYALGSMVCAAVLLMLLFWRRGWFGRGN